jgi:hypothetical protein
MTISSPDEAEKLLVRVKIRSVTFQKCRFHHQFIEDDLEEGKTYQMNKTLSPLQVKLPNGWMIGGLIRITGARPTI